MQARLERNFQRLCPDPSEGFFSLRWVREQGERLRMQQGVLLPVDRAEDQGIMVSAWIDGGVGYAATNDLSEKGIGDAIARARQWALRTQGSSVLSGVSAPPPNRTTGEYRGAVERSWDGTPLSEKIERLRQASEALRSHEEIVSWEAELWFLRWHTLHLTNAGGRAEQQSDMLCPNLTATAHRDGETQTRSLRDGFAQQGGLEVLDRADYFGAAKLLGEQARALLSAPNCPSGKMAVILSPDQMMLQIHESIGHPLELDRILGDERNYAGGSFVTLDMFGTYRYGSELLNVSFDPTEGGELASYAFDDDGNAAAKVRVIERGMLVAPLGSALSRARAEHSGHSLNDTANARASSWNRPAIDRMANLNLEPGDRDFTALIANVERGVYLETNRSWSIDDSRNKFQFGCEQGHLIEDGRIVGLVKNPSYRGVSATFWRSLDAVGNESTRGIHGTPYCGKGEPNQVIRVGHASPACRFRDVDVFGGES